MSRAVSTVWLRLSLAAVMLSISVSAEQDGCVVNCCILLPDCLTPRSMHCRCPDTEQATLQMDALQLTPLLRSVTVTLTPAVTLNSNSISSLSFMKMMSVRNVTQLHIESDGLMPSVFAKFSSLEIIAAQNVSLAQWALTGEWSSEADVKIEDVESLTLSENAFHFSAKHVATPGVGGPNVSIRNVRLLSLGTKAFTATLSKLDFVDVTMDECPSAVFGIGVRSVNFTRVEIREVKRHCFDREDRVLELSFQSCHFGIVQPFGILRAFSLSSPLSINDTYFGEIKSNGFLVSVHSFEMINTKIDVLDSGSLYILSGNGIRFQNVTIGYLRTHAFIRIGKGAHHVVEMHKLLIEHAENGSFVFDSRAEVNISAVTFTNCTCPWDQWLEALVLTPDQLSTDITANQRYILQQLTSTARCVDNGMDRIPLPDYCSQLAAPVASSSPSPSSKSSSAEVSVAVAGGVAGAVMLAIVIGLVMIIMQKKKRLRSDNKPFGLEMLASQVHRSSEHRKCEVAPENTELAEEDDTYEQVVYNDVDNVLCISSVKEAEVSESMENDYDLVHHDYTPADELNEDLYESVETEITLPANSKEPDEGLDDGSLLKNLLYATSGDAAGDIDIWPESQSVEEAVMHEYSPITYDGDGYGHSTDATAEDLPEYAVVLPRSKR